MFSNNPHKTNGMVCDGQHAEFVITPVTSLLANQHIASESEMWVNMHVICVDV